VAESAAPAGLERALATLIEAWALLGGLLLLAVVLLNTASIIGGAVFGTPFPGDFELTEVGIGVAAFAFLPYGQLSGANVTADIFTSRASPRAIAVLTLAASCTALVFALLLLWRMSAGMIDQKTYGYTTAILQVPHWWAFLPILISLALLAIAALITLRRDLRRVRAG